MGKFCYRCGAPIDALEPVSRSELCSGCGSYIRCCLNCSFHDENAHNQCRETQSEPIYDRETGNFCDFFRIAERKAKTEDSLETDDARRRFDALFSKKNE